MSKDYNGFVRETAVVRLSGLKSLEAFRALVERLNDWVPEVRRAALLAIDAYLRPQRIEVLWAALDDLARLAGKRRVDHQSVLGRMIAVLDMHESREFVVAHLPKLRGKAARFLFAHLGLKESTWRRQIMKFAAVHAEFPMRLMAAQFCAKEADSGDVKVLARLANDRHCAVRREAIKVLMERKGGTEEKQRWMCKALLDSAPSLRELGLWHARHSAFDAHGFLQQQLLATQGWPVPALLGLIASLQVRSQSSYVSLAFESEQADVRRAALAAAVRVRMEGCEEVVARALADTSHKVARVAMRFLLKGDIALSNEVLCRAVRTLIARGEATRAISLASTMMLWDSLVCILQVLSEEESRADERFVMLLDAWRGWAGERQYVRMDAMQKAFLNEVLSNATCRQRLQDLNRLDALLEVAGR